LSFLEKYKGRKGLVLSEKLFDEKSGIKFRPIFSVNKEINSLKV